MEFVRVVVNGALGRMGKAVVNAVAREPGLKVVGAVEKEVTQQYIAVGEPPELVPFSSDLGSLLKNCNADVVVDFTNAEACIRAARTAIKQGVNMVIGTTGLSEGDLGEIEQLCQTNGVGVVISPDFSFGAALLVHLSSLAAKFFDHAEIVEMQHDKKADVPWGTAIATARAMLQMRGKPFVHPEVRQETVRNTRGGQMDGIAIHSVRLPGFLAAQEVILSGAGESLTIRHDAISRDGYLPGVIMAIKAVTQRKGLTYGLHALLEL